MKRVGDIFFNVALSCACLITGVYAGTDGYLVSDDGVCAVGWTEGAYKVFRSDPVFTAPGDLVRISAAGNEYEPFILVLWPKTRMDRVRVEAGPLRDGRGSEIPANHITICHVDCVPVTVPTDAAGAAGDWPDPLPPYDGPFTAHAGENHALWITVYVPAGSAAGLYRGSLRLSCGGWLKEIRVELKVRAFSLPGTASIRSSFGLPVEQIKRYHNLKTGEELEKVYDLYMQNLRAHRVCPRNPLDLYPMKVAFSGIDWTGGEFVSSPVHSGRRALRIEDNSASANAEARTLRRTPIRPGVSYELSWFARTEKDGQEYTVLVQCYNAEGEHMPGLNALKVFTGSTEWKPDRLSVPAFPPEARTVTVHLFPVFRDIEGGLTGTVFFDDLVLSETGKENILAGGDFEMDLEAVGVDVDFGEFDRGAMRYLDEFGFNSFDLSLEGLGSGSFHSREAGFFAGFRQGSPEYDRLLSQYLRKVEKHLEERGWLGREYIYWFDEPDAKDYPFVREGMMNIRKNAPRLTRFITEHQPGPDIMDVSEIGCTIFHRIDPSMALRLAGQGRELWSYLCTGPKAPWVTLFIDHPAVNLRIWLWMSYQYRLEGILVWRANYWDSSTVFPPEAIQNPWEDPMSYTVGYGRPFGQVNHWGNGDGRFLYPPNRDPNNDNKKHLADPVNSVRWEILREGIEDYEYFKLLEKAVAGASKSKKEIAAKSRELLDIPKSIFSSGREYTKNPRALLEYRERVARAVEILTSAND